MILSSLGSKNVLKNSLNKGSIDGPTTMAASIDLGANSSVMNTAERAASEMSNFDEQMMDVTMGPSPRKDQNKKKKAP